MNIKELFKNQFSADKDTKDRITPVAFSPDQSLFDLPLARPWRRGSAMLCDLMIIAVLTALDDVVLISLLLALWLFHKAKQGKKLSIFGDYTTWVVRGFSFLIIAAGFYASSQLFVKNDHEEINTKNETTSSSVAKAALIGLSIYQGEQCETALCWQPYLTTLIDSSIAISPNFNVSDVAELVDNILEDSALSAQEQQALKTWALAQPQWQTDQLSAQRITPADNTSDANLNKTALNDSNNDENIGSSQSATSPMKWLFGVIDDLGLGFGFAAIYFTCFTAWFNGQTLGKMLFNTRVIQLSNKPMGLWSSFGRYGGYGAGLATGLLGFFQIYWDANRQAIQDQISATVVIDLTLAAKEEKLVAGLFTYQAVSPLDNQLAQTEINAQDDVPKNMPQARSENDK
jgi:uncharacterized RDD family membrane protein YckC